MNSLEEMISKPAGRRDFLVRLGSAGLGVAAGTLIAGCGGGSNNAASAGTPSNDQAILNAAATAEALATVMYYNIIQSTIFTGAGSNAIGSNAPDQAYLVAAYQEEINHYNTLVGAGATPLTTTFYFPTGMFSNSTTANLQTTINTLTTLESAFIAAYLYAVSGFSTVGNKVLAAQIMGIEAEHRALARVIAHDVGLSSTVDFGGQTESVVPPNAAANDLAYERTYGITSISTVVTALGPFTTAPSGGSTFSSTPYTYASATTNGQPTTITGFSGFALDNSTPSN